MPIQLKQTVFFSEYPIFAFKEQNKKRMSEQIMMIKRLKKYCEIFDIQGAKNTRTGKLSL